MSDVNKETVVLLGCLELLLEGTSAQNSRFSAIIR